VVHAPRTKRCPCLFSSVFCCFVRLSLVQDLKPENILITSDGVAKLGDFGHATTLPDEGRVLHPTVVTRSGRDTGLYPALQPHGTITYCCTGGIDPPSCCWVRRDTPRRWTCGVSAASLRRCTWVLHSSATRMTGEMAMRSQSVYDSLFRCSGCLAHPHQSPGL
jgi:hypothetical protein